jgi:hypothetical protein
MRRAAAHASLCIRALTLASNFKLVNVIFDLAENMFDVQVDKTAYRLSFLMFGFSFPNWEPD